MNKLNIRCDFLEGIPERSGSRQIVEETPSDIECGEFHLPCRSGRLRK